ncbi:MAG: TIM44-like domain-containing protein [Pseudolabrys sp.]|nr:TIM44-like domain-containing protein [Pseudolabrys sp.]
MFHKLCRLRCLVAFGAIVAALTLVAADVEARVGGGSSSGSRGSRTFSAPPVTRTAPTQAQPMQRTITQPGAPSTVGAPATASRPGFFGGGLLGGLAAGFIGAGLFGLLFGHGFLGGMAGFASILGLVLQIVLIVIVARLIWSWWQRRNAPAYATANAAPQQETRSRFDNLVSGFGGGSFGGGGEPVTIGKEDYDAFQDLLIGIQAAYSEEDLGKLRGLVTPEMLSYFADDLAANASRGVVNRVRDVQLLQGDLAEAWREGATEYATVAMRFSLDDRVVDRSTGREIEGGPQEATELWTFMRSRGGHWILSAIQQS